MKHFSEPAERDDEPVETAFVDAVLEDIRQSDQSSWIDPYANRQVEAVEEPRPSVVEGPRVWNENLDMWDDEIPHFFRADAVPGPRLQTKAEIARIRANRGTLS